MHWQEKILSGETSFHSSSTLQHYSLVVWYHITF